MIYIANILYVVFVRKFSKLLLAIFMAFAGCMMIAYLVTGTQGYLIRGWLKNRFLIKRS